MTQDEIDTMWQKAMHQSIKEGEMFTRYQFAKLVAAKEREACAKVVQTHLEASDDLRTKGTLVSVLDYIKFRGEQA